MYSMSLLDEVETADEELGESQERASEMRGELLRAMGFDPDNQPPSYAQTAQEIAADLPIQAPAVRRMLNRLAEEAKVMKGQAHRLGSDGRHRRFCVYWAPADGRRVRGPNRTGLQRRQHGG